MFKALYTKLAAALGLLFILACFLFVSGATLTANVYSGELNQKLNKDLASNIVAQSGFLKDKQIDTPKMGALFHDLMSVNPSIEIYLLDAQGALLAYSAPKEKVLLPTIDITSVEKFLKGTIPILGDDPKEPNIKKVFSAASIPMEIPAGSHEQQQLARHRYLYIILSGQDAASIASMVKGSYILRAFALILLIALGVFLATALILFIFFTRRLKRLAQAMREFKQHGFVAPVPQYQCSGWGSDEIDEFGSTFNEMANLIVEQLSQLKKTNTERRELVENISHDVRRPLASLQGYLETLLLKADSLAPDVQRTYLEKAMKNSQTCTRFVTELFQLARLEAKEGPYNPESFSLEELIQDILQEFDITAKERGVHLKTNFESQLPMVRADIGLIERVLRNLIENAIQHTDQEGVVTATLTLHPSGILVSISDTGCGMSEANLARIFDRFYQADEQRSLEDHAGLGLAISKRIIELHHSRLEVISELGKGSTFSFLLNF